MADPGSSGAPTGWAAWGKAQLQSVLALVIAAVATLGFVAFAGGAVLWARAYALGLPPDQIVSIVPRTELVATGASSLTGFVLLGLLATVVVYILDPHGMASSQTRFGLVLLLAAEIAVAVYYARPSESELKQIAVLMGCDIVAILLMARFVSHEKQTLHPSVDGRIVRELTPLGQGLTIMLIGLALAGTWTIFHEWWLVAVVGTALGLYVAVVTIARGTGTNFVPTGAAVFASAVIFGAAMAGLHYTDSRQVQPIAALRTGEGAPVCGIFIAESGDRLYMARLDRDPKHDGSTGDVFWLDRKAVEGWALANLQSRNDADAALPALADRVLQERRTQSTHTHTEKRAETTDNDKSKVRHSGRRTITLAPAADRDAPPCSVYADSGTNGAAPVARLR